MPAALRILTEGKVADVDLGHVAGRHFANSTSLGPSVQVAGHVRHQLKRILGRAAYPVTALALLPRHPPFTAQLRVTDGTGNDGGDGTGGSETRSQRRSKGPAAARLRDHARQHGRPPDTALRRPVRAAATGTSRATFIKATSAGPNAMVITSAARSC